MSVEPANDLFLIEYEQLKAEQRARIGLRDNLIYVTLAAYAAIAAAALTVKGQAHLLLVVPFAATLLGWTHLANDEKISSLGRYVRSHLAPRLESLRPDATPVFAWEAEHRTGRGRTTRKLLQLAVDLATFNLPALVTLAIYWADRPLHGPLLALSVVELVATVVLAWQRITQADLR
ncbi:MULTISPECIES: hypothetical protein [unclassified Solwaraspora]|uniref:hypothetical protein n=1 Tax=unclassified Solwaraspora TaxID=2627926 RepID=UPI00259BA20F|nr:hypothetical protein [Solwaraspora sp. WMMA2056]WJK38733.1 hypothetical protein O7608_19775 [Solwaraspora sp. WMMA2056]